MRRRRWMRRLIRLMPLILVALVLILILGLLIRGCGKRKEGSKMVFTKALTKDEVFRIGDEVCTAPEMRAYLATTQSEYERVYGVQIWNTSLDGVTLEEYVKDKVLEKAAQIKTMYLLAKSKNITLTDQEKDFVKAAAKDFVGQMSVTQREAMGLTEEIAEEMFREYAMANKVYLAITSDVNPEISDDEARIVTVQQVLIRTSTIDAEGNRVEYLTARKDDAYELALRIRDEAVEGKKSFEELASRYSEDPTLTYSFGKGEVDPAIEAVAFKMETGEISGVVESADGYHVLKCISTFDAQETEANKKKILEERRNEAFGQEYDEFVNSLARKLNEAAWNEIRLVRDGTLPTADFFDVYDKFFSKN